MIGRAPWKRRWRSETPHGARRTVTAISAVRIGIGAGALVAPGRFAALMGFPPDHDTATARLMGRLFGVRDVALGVLALGVRDEPRLLRATAGLQAAVDAGDAASMGFAVVRREGIDRAALSSAAIASSAVVLWLGLRRALDSAT